MTVQVRRDKEIYAADGGWIQARWHFTFDQYYDPQQGLLEAGAAQVMRFSSSGALHCPRRVPACRRLGAGQMSSHRACPDAPRAAGDRGPNTQLWPAPS